MKSPEEQLQRAVTDYLWILRNQGTIEFFAVPNGGFRKKSEAARMKAQGVRAGVPDIQILFPGGRSLFIELKAGRGSLSPGQKEWRDWLTGASFAWQECRSLEDVQAAINRVRLS